MLASQRRGTVYGVLLNHRDARTALGEAVHAAPYKAPPRAPVLYIKPRNTWVGPGEAVVVPSAAALTAEAARVAGVEAVSPAAAETPLATGARAAVLAGTTSASGPGTPPALPTPELQIGATIGLVIGRTASHVDESRALDHVAGLAIVADLSLPHPSYYRPSLRFIARDTFCSIGPTVPVAALGHLASFIGAARLAVEIDGHVAHRAGFADLLRSPARLLAEVSEFMTLVPGDVLLLGVAAGAPRARAGQRVAIAVDGLGRLENPLVEEVEEVEEVDEIRLAARDVRSIAGEVRQVVR